MKFISKEKMEKLNTKRLLAYKNKLMQVPELDFCDCNKLNKNNKDWQETFFNLKDVLAYREHI